ncbi:NTP transferase domain-containing protein [Fontisphaera persica]|uniref:RraA family protein n=1 Tax=Fontisphaera persica TaxID=2974023 RepID=UPI0024BF7CD1|nr:NTP transferase domain-containing protein [Fontisphaera persica]WCJ58180.1 NTP transferase domain-containing protein [Fontisphaera persica]
MKVAAFLPAKGSSDRLPNKNTMLLDGEPLFLRGLRKLLACPSVDEVWLDTESAQIEALAGEVKCRILRRDPLLASNKTDGHQLFLNEVRHCDADICVQLLCTSPFIRPQTIERAIEVLKTDASYDSVVAVRKEKQYRWENGRPLYNLEHIPNSADLEDTIVESMGLYVMRREAALATGRRIGNHPYLLPLDPLESVDVNWPADFEMANLIAIGQREQERRLFANMKLLLSSPLLSDLLDDMKLEGVLSREFQLNLPDSKILGRAKTLQIDVCADDEDFRKIYEGLNLYDHVVSNDVIVVANHAPGFAFFGELNANLAVRSGAVGAVIDGVTRDWPDTRRMGFPVFAKGHYCRDTRKRGIVTSRNRTIVVDGISIHKDDLIFGDSDGIVVIPRKHEQAILKEAMSRKKNEADILLAIAQGIQTSELVKQFGLF